MDYNETIELEKNIKLKNKADKIYSDFMENVTLKTKSYCKNGRFIVWRDSHNTKYIRLENDVFYFECRFLHESYDMEITPPSIFNHLKNDYRGIDHLMAHLQTNYKIKE